MKVPKKEVKEAIVKTSAMQDRIKRQPDLYKRIQ